MFAMKLASVFLVLCVSQAISGRYIYQSNEFFAAFPKNGNFLTLQIPKLHITTTESSPVTVTVTTSIDIGYSVTVQPHSTASININKDLLVASNNDINKGIHIKTNNNQKISVYATNYVTTSAGGFPVLPLYTYDDLYVPEYIYFAFSTDTDSVNAANGIKSVVLLTGGFNDTTVTITPTQNITIPAGLVDGNDAVLVAAGQSYTLTLDPMQTLLLNNKLDLSGTKIVANKPLSVISGHECGVVPPKESYCDHMVEQIPPSVTWGRKYMSMPFAKRNSGALFKLISHIPNNEVNITCNNVTSNQRTTSSLTLLAGNISVHQITNDEWCSFVSEYPMIITQYAFGGAQEIGDPLSMVLIPIEQYTDLSLGDIITPPSPFVDSHKSDQEHIVGIFVFDELPENMTLDGSLALDDLSWRTIYTGDNILGYGLSVDITEASHYVSGSLSNTALVSVVVYGFTSELNAFGYPVNGALEPISLPWRITFNRSNYTVVENQLYKIPVTSINSLGSTVSLSVQTCPGTQPLSNVVFDNTITFYPNDAIKFITINSMDDKNIEELESMCLEITAPSSQLVFLYPYSNTDVYIVDDEGVQLSLIEAKLINNDLNLELSLRLSGYEGEANSAFTVDVSIADSLNGMLQTPIEISSFTVHFTKYLIEVKYVVPFEHQEAVSHDSVILIAVSDTDLNVSITSSGVPLLPPPNFISSISASSFSPVTTVVTTSLTSSITHVTSRVPLGTSIPTLEVTREPVTTVLGRANTVELDLYVVYLIIGLISVLGIVVLMLIIAVVCFYMIHQQKTFDYHAEKQSMTKNCNRPSTRNSEHQLTAQSTDNRFSQDSAIYSRSASPSRSSRSNSPRSDGNFHLKTAANDSSPRHSMAGSKDNLLQSTAV